MAYFDTGLIKIKGEVIKLQEVNINASRDINEVYSSDSHDPEEIRPGRKKIDFTIKKALDNGRLARMYEEGCEFPLLVYNNDVKPPQPVMVLERCVFGKDSIGNFDGTKPVTQDLDGKAVSRRILLDETRSAPANTC